MSHMFRIKICGVTRAADACMAADAGADAIGLNFYPGSRRYLSPEAANEVAAAIPQGVLKVGVFVNADPEFVAQEGDRLALDLIQLSGDETPESMQPLGKRRLVKVFRPRSDSPKFSVATLIDFLRQTDGLGCLPKVVMFDSYRPGEFGGTGDAIDWRGLAGFSARYLELASRHFQSAPMLALAGGLAADNVGEAIRLVGPAAVDVASGVESSPGIKDPERVRRFIRAALAGFGEHSSPQSQASSASA